MRGAEQSGNVFQKREVGSNFANDSDRFRPTVALIVARFAASGCTEWLTREPTGDDVDKSVPWRSFERCDVAPNWSIVEDSVFDPSHDDALTITVAFDVADCPPSEQFRRVFSPSNPAKK